MSKGAFRPPPCPGLRYHLSFEYLMSRPRRVHRATALQPARAPSLLAPEMLALEGRPHAPSPVASVLFAYPRPTLVKPPPPSKNQLF
eukprot:scaffold10829_cov129-Isochrysis_galbana.AAC.4